MVIYGRRRAGKTALINQFIQGKNVIYFMGVESSARQNLENFSRSILEYRTGIETDGSFYSLQAALEYVFRLSEQEKFSIAIGEYPYAARSEKGLASTIRLLVDRYKENIKNTFLNPTSALLEEPEICSGRRYGSLRFITLSSQQSQPVPPGCRKSPAGSEKTQMCAPPT